MIDHATVEQLAKDVWSSMLKTTVIPAENKIESNQQTMFMGHVGIEGDWQVQVFLACPYKLAQHWASIMFMTEIADITDDEVGDAIGELINMVAGNIKGVLPGENTLSLPTVEQVTAQEFVDAKCKNADIHFECEQQPMVIRMSDPIPCEMGVE